MAKDQKTPGAENDQEMSGTNPSDPNPSTNNKAKKTRKVLVVVAKHEGFRRAGFSFGSEPARLIVSELTDEQVEQLKGEPMLVVTEVDEEI